MAIHMGNTGFLGRGQRLLSLDYTGSFRRKSGCVTDAAAYGRCVAGLAAKAGDATYFVAGDAPSAVDAVANAIARAAPNTTVVATPGHPIHTGRVDHIQHANRTHHSGHAEGTLKALVDFMMLVASDVFLSNCPDGGSTFVTTLWSKGGNQGSTWKSADVSIAVSIEQLKFVYTSGSSFTGDFALD